MPKAAPMPILSARAPRAKGATNGAAPLRTAGLAAPHRVLFGAAAMAAEMPSG